jgi:hypothetical protein
MENHALCEGMWENHALCEGMWENILEQGRPPMTMWLMCIACWIPKATDTHLEHVILLAFPLHDGCMSVLQCYAIRILAISLSMHQIVSVLVLEESETVPSAS